MTRDIRFVDVRSTFYSQNYCNVRSWPHSICAQCYSPFIDFVHAALNSTVCVEILQCGWSLFIEACSGYASETHILWAVVVFSSSSSSSLVTGSIARSANLPVFRLLRGRFFWICLLENVQHVNSGCCLCYVILFAVVCDTAGWVSWRSLKITLYQPFVAAAVL